MKFSSNDILSQTFSSKFMGYAPEQVDEFLSSLANEWTRIVKELDTLNEQNTSLKEEVKECRRREHGLHDALQMAKKVADEIREKAESEATRIVTEAETKAKEILQTAERDLDNLRNQILGLRQQRALFEDELRASLKAHLNLLDSATSGQSEIDEESITSDDEDDDFSDESSSVSAPNNRDDEPTAEHDLSQSTAQQKVSRHPTKKSSQTKKKSKSLSETSSLEVTR